MTSEQVTAIEAALKASTQGKWEWHGVFSPNFGTDKWQISDSLRVTTSTPDKDWDAETAFVLEGLKTGILLRRNADAELIANAPDWLRALLAERERLLAVAQNARIVAKHLDKIKVMPSVLRDKNNGLIEALVVYDKVVHGDE